MAPTRPAAIAAGTVTYPLIPMTTCAPRRRSSAAIARVVRHTSCDQETVDGFGVRFLSFDGNGRSRLLDLLRASRELARAGGPTPDGCCPGTETN